MKNSKSIFCLIKTDGLTLNKIYYILGFDETESYYLLKDDYDNLQWYSRDLFKTITELRDDKLKQIGI